MYEDEDDKPNEKLDKVIQKERERLEREKNDKRNSEKKHRNGHAGDGSKNKLKDSPSTNPPKTSKFDSPKNDSGKASVSNESDRPSTSGSKRQSSPLPVPPVKKRRETKERTYKPFYKLLEGVVLVISGIQVRVTRSDFNNTIFLESIFVCSSI